MVFFSLNRLLFDPDVVGGSMMGSVAAELIAEFNDTKELRPDIAKQCGATCFACRRTRLYQITNGQKSLMAI
jgi:hypothetical protein